LVLFFGRAKKKTVLVAIHPSPPGWPTEKFLFLIKLTSASAASGGACLKLRSKIQPCVRGLLFESGARNFLKQMGSGFRRSDGK
jgi:hypothetical protein